MLTGARQVGKSTLAAAAFPDYPVVNLDSPVERAVYERLSPADWISRFPRAIIDEAQKLPSVFETVKACYDRDPSVRYVLLGSSQILVMKGVKESLAGRAALSELFPFTLPEIAASGGVEPSSSRFVTLALDPDPASRMAELFPPQLAIHEDTAAAKEVWSSFVESGAMPLIVDPGWTREDRREWLKDYRRTYLERDLLDIARLDRLEPFARAQKAAALRASKPVNFADLARLSDVSAPTAKQFMRYLEMSYQVFWLPAWSRNREKRLSKRPKLHFVDPGLLRVVAGVSGEPTGEHVESAVAAEVFKQLRAARIDAEFHHLRTVDGREVDLLLEREDGYVAIEVKRAGRVHPVDFKHMRGLDDILDKPLELALVVSSDPDPRPMDRDDPRFWAVPAWSLLG